MVEFYFNLQLVETFLLESYFNLQLVEKFVVESYFNLLLVEKIRTHKWLKRTLFIMRKKEEKSLRTFGGKKNLFKLYNNNFSNG